MYEIYKKKKCARIRKNANRGLREYSPCVDGGRISDVVHGRFPRMKPRVKFVTIHPKLHKRGMVIRGLPHFARTNWRSLRLFL